MISSDGKETVLPGKATVDVKAGVCATPVDLELVKGRGGRGGGRGEGWERRVIERVQGGVGQGLFAGSAMINCILCMQKTALSSVLLRSDPFMSRLQTLYGMFSMC